MWVTIQESDLLTGISGPELAGIRSAALATGQSDPVQPTLDQVTRLIRGRVAACRHNRLGEGNTIPDELMEAAVAIALMKLPARAAGLTIDPDGTRQSAADDAQDLLKEVAACRFAVQQPETVSEEQTAAPPKPAMQEKNRRFTRTSQDGL